MPTRAADGGARVARVLVTGAAGFVGSAFVRHVLRTRPDARVLSFDLLTYAGHLENLDDLPDPARHEFVRGDVADVDAVATAVGVFRPTAIVNLAAETHVDRSHLDPLRFVRTNVLGAQVLLDAAHAAGVRLIQVSTDEVYGDLPAPASARPDDPPCPTSPYAASKAAADLLARAAFRTRGQDVVVTRCTNNYGPRQTPEKAIPFWTTRAAAGETLPVYGDGRQVRDWIHVDDHAEGLLLALERGASGSVHHFAGRTPRTNLDVLAAVLRATGASPSLVRHVADRPAHDRRYALDDEDTRATLRWAPRVAFEEGLRATVAWYRDHPAWVAAAAGPDLRAFLRRNYDERSPVAP